MEHELQHVEVFRQVLAEAVRDLAAELPDAVGRGVQRAATPADLQQRVAARINDHVAEFIRERRRVLEERQAAVDSPQEYARVRSACPQ
jgi:ubiquinone biosynthesis protein UbiJ